MEPTGGFGSNLGGLRAKAAVDQLQERYSMEVHHGGSSCVLGGIIPVGKLSIRFNKHGDRWLKNGGYYLLIGMILQVG